MQALILNSGTGRRMGSFTDDKPKCMVELSGTETILSRQLNKLIEAGIKDIVITTGYCDSQIADYCSNLNLAADFTFVRNEKYAETNYIYSMYLARQYIKDDVILLHGDIVFEDSALDMLLAYAGSRMAISTTVPLPEKDFKAIINGDRIDAVGVEFFDKTVSAQPLYKFTRGDFQLWMSEINQFCENGNTCCYAENALNNVLNRMNLGFVNVGNLVCCEVDTAEDLSAVKRKLGNLDNRRVFMSFSTDIIHGGHIAILKRAAKIGKVTVGVLTDEAVASYKHFPIIPYKERKSLFENIVGIDKVIKQTSLSCKDFLLNDKPDFVIHGDDWRTGNQRPARSEVIETLSEYGGSLIEFPYNKAIEYDAIEKELMRKTSIPDIRRGKLRKLLAMKPIVRIIESHNGISALIAEKTVAYQDGAAYQFDGMWLSSLCDSTAKGKPDIELVDMTSRFRTIDDIIEVTTKPIIFDGDTGGLLEHFVYTVRTLERMGVSAVIIEDKIGLKRNSLFGTDVEQQQDSVENFSAKITAGKSAQRTSDFMIIARIESLILERGISDALTRAHAFVKAGADGIMIHSRKKSPDEIFEFAGKFRESDKHTPLVVVPTTFGSVTEDEFQKRGINIVIYANHLLRSAFPAMKRAAEDILINHRGMEAESKCISINEILTLIPEET